MINLIISCQSFVHIFKLNIQKPYWGEEGGKVRNSAIIL